MRGGFGVFKRVKKDRTGFVGSRSHISKQKALGDVGHPVWDVGHPALGLEMWRHPARELGAAGASDAENALEVGEEFDLEEARGL